MPRIGVDYGASQNLFGSGQSLGAALAGAIGGGGELKRELIGSQIEAKNAYTRATLAKAGLDEQEVGARSGLGQSAADIARYRATQGSSNAQHAGASPAPAPIDIVDAQSRQARYSQMLSTGAADSAVGLNKTMGGLGMMFGPADQMRPNYALTGGHPTDNTVLGPMDTAGTKAQIAIDAAEVPNKIAIDTAKQKTELQLDPMKNPDSRLVELEAKAQRGPLTPDEEAQRQFIRRAKYGKPDISFEDKGTGEHVVMPAPGDKIGQLYPSREPPPPTAAPAVVDPMAPAAPAPAGAPANAAPAVVGQPGDLPGTMRFGSPKPTAAPTGEQGKIAKFARAKIDAEATLQNFTDGRQLPTQVDGYIRSVMNSGMTAQQIWDQLPDERSRAYFDAAFLFLTGTLREESGAAIGQTEFAMRYPTLLPSPNATPEEIRRKAALRKSDIDGDFAFLPLHLQQALDDHARRAGVMFHDADVPYAQPYRPPAVQQGPHPDDDIVEITPVGP